MAKIDFDMNDTIFGKSLNERDRNRTIDYDDDNNDYEPRIHKVDVEEEKKYTELERSKWKSRRRMAWVALASEVLATITLFAMPIEVARMNVLSDIIMWFYFSMTSIVGFYMGATTWAYLGKGRMIK